MVFNRGIGVNTCVVVNPWGLAGSTVTTAPDMKLGYRSAVFKPLVRLDIEPTERRLAFFLAGRRRLAGTLFLLRRFAARFFLKRFFEPRGKNLPLASLGNDLASFLPIAAFLADFLRFFLGISSFCSY